MKECFKKLNCGTVSYIREHPILTYPKCYILVDRPALQHLSSSVLSELCSCLREVAKGLYQGFAYLNLKSNWPRRSLCPVHDLINIHG